MRDEVLFFFNDVNKTVRGGAVAHLRVSSQKRTPEKKKMSSKNKGRVRWQGKIKLERSKSRFFFLPLLYIF